VRAMPLFRKEVLDQDLTRSMGSVSIAHPINIKLLFAASALATLLAIAYLSIGSYTRRTSVIGRLVPTQGLATVLAPSTGVVSQIHATQGDKVNAGEVLAVITTPRDPPAQGDAINTLDAQIQQKQKSLNSAKTAREQQLASQSTSLSEQIHLATSETQEIEAEISIRRNQIHIAHEIFERLQRLQDGGYVSLLQIKQQESSILEQTSILRNLRRQAEEARHLVSQLNQALREIPNQRVIPESDYLREMALLEQERVELNRSQHNTSGLPSTTRQTACTCLPGHEFHSP